MFMASRPSKSSTCTSLMALMVTFPSIKSLILGMIFILTLVCLQMAIISETSILETDGMAIMISSISLFSTIAIISLRLPKTGIPMIKCLNFAGSSSTKATGYTGEFELFTSSFAINIPQSPAPIINAFRWFIFFL
ncbi:hypothetical protein D3C85_1478130 [compost metagenome]